MTTPQSILVIEDDPGVAQSLRDGLEREGFQVRWAPTCAEGEAAARAAAPQLIILDVRLPDGSGLDVCRRLRAGGLRQPILILTVEHDEIDRVLGLELGADDYLSKPFGMRELMARVRALLRRAYGELSSANSDTLLVGDLLIDRARAVVTRAGRPLALTPTEFRLLLFLARNGGQALTRAQIIEAVWGYDAEIGDEHTVNVHIRRLREKIEPDPARPTLILTVPGIGYRLAARS